jgi:hypothetical protein
MRKIFYFITAILVVSCTVSSHTSWPTATVESKPGTRWWWLGSAVDKENLTYNLEEFAKAGIGSVEITPIYGVKDGDEKYIDYLSAPWMDMLAHTEAEARRLGMNVDMNTGTGWPFGGPEVTVEDAATKAIFQEYKVLGNQYVEMTIAIDDPKQKEISSLSRLMAFSGNGQRIDITSNLSGDGVLKWDAPQGEWRVIALFVGKTRQQVKRAAPGGVGLVMNHFDKNAVANYLSKYDKAFAAQKVSFPNGFFNDSYEVYGANWSPSLLEEFAARRDYKLEDYLPELLDKGNTEISRRVVSDYRETVGEMLLENFTNQWTSWAHTHGAVTRNQAHGSPANILDLYAAVDIPECEIFGITDFKIPGLRKDSLVRNNDGDPVTLKFASSAAHVAGKQFTSSETFTWLTEHFRTSLSQCKTEIDQVFTSGVNHVYFHGSPYSPKEAAWPGWLFYASVNMSPTNSIWKDAPAFFKYIERTQSFLQYGIPDNDLLVYFPVYDIWYEQQDNFFFSFAIHGLREKLPKFYQTVEKIRESGRDVDYISDKFIRSASVENGLIRTSGGVSYKALVLPAARIIPQETLASIIDLAEAGAKIIFVDHYPQHVPGLLAYEEREAQLNQLVGRLPDVDFSATALNRLGKGEIITGSSYDELFSNAKIASEEFSTKYNGQLVRRKNDTGHHYFLTMLSDNTIDGWISLGVQAKSAIYFNPMNGRSGKAALRNSAGKTEVYLQLKPGESIILKTFSDYDVKAPQWIYYDLNGNKIRLSEGWNMQFVESWPKIVSTFSIDSLGSWTGLPDENAKINMGTARYRIRFDMDKSESKEYLLNLGDVRESARVFVNGSEVATLFSVPFEVNIGQFLKQGSNMLEVEVTNLPANRIADYDRQGIEWRIFNEINFVDINYKKSLYDKWEAVPSGLLGPVTIMEVGSKQIKY